VVAEVIGKWIFTAYGVELVIQGVVVGLIFAGVFAHFAEKG
jgi:hypothetical protein